MRSLNCSFVALVLAAAQASCTFYTACPTGNGSAPTAGSGNAGGNGQPGGGSGNVGGPPAPLDGEWVNVTSNLSGRPSECGNLSFGTAKPDEDLLIVGVARDGLWGSRNGGESWERLGSDSDPEPITNRATSILFDPDAPDTFWESGLYNGTGVFKTTDGGKSFEPLRVSHNDYITVDLTDPDRKTMVASGHEQVHKLMLSTNGASTWTEIGDFIPDEAAVCSFPLLMDADTFLLGCGTYAGGKAGTYRTTDRGKTYEPVSDIGGGSAPLLAKDGTLYWAGEAGLGMAKSTDQGETWSDAVGVDVIWTFNSRTSPLELPDGRIVQASKQSLIVSDDQGETWKAVSAALPYEPATFFYSVQQRAFFITRITCGVGTDAVPSNGIMRFDFDYETD